MLTKGALILQQFKFVFLYIFLPQVADRLAVDFERWSCHRIFMQGHRPVR